MAVQPSTSSQRSLLEKLNHVASKIVESTHLKTHKHFRVTVPQAITGQNLVQIIQDSHIVEDNADALHMATILMHYGYLFPVIEQAQQVKDDNTLYRIQLPYFWPSHSQQTDNVEYAIYLNKRLMRSEQRHGLEEDEVESFNKLAQLLGHMWVFITTQAEMQLKMQKERKKADKVVFDSEERAFWRQRTPGQSNHLEEPIQKISKKVRKKAMIGYRQEIERLRLALKTKPWLKALKASDTMVNWCEQFQEYDPFIASCQPTNPWISDDLALWVLNADNVEVPTERRVKRWGLSVQELVRDPIGRQVLETFLESEFSSENIRFWMSIQDLKYSPNCQIISKSQRVHDEFLASGAPYQVNVDSRTLEETLKFLKAGSDVAKRYAYSIAEEHVFTLMSKDSYPRFLRSQIYKGVLGAAQQQGSRRLGWRNFIFIGGAGGSGGGGGGSSGGGGGGGGGVGGSGGGSSNSGGCSGTASGGVIPINNQKRTPLTTKQHKISRENENSINSQLLPKQLSSDSLPIKVVQQQQLLTSIATSSGSSNTSPILTPQPISTTITTTLASISSKK